MKTYIKKKIHGSWYWKCLMCGTIANFGDVIESGKCCDQVIKPIKPKKK